MPAVLYATPASHPCAVVERALQLKNVDYRRVDLLPVVHKLVQQLRFGAPTVPGLAFGDGTRVSGSRAILRALDERAPEPALVPPDRAKDVLRAEEWGDLVLQPIARRVVLATLRRAPDAVVSYRAGAKLPIPEPLAQPAAPFFARAAARINGATEPAVRADLLTLPAHLDRVDDWIAEGVLAGAAVNAADLQIGASLRLLLTIGDVAPLIADRPAESLALQVFASYPGRIPPGVLPSAWLPRPGGGVAARG